LGKITIWVLPYAELLQPRAEALVYACQGLAMLTTLTHIVGVSLVIGGSVRAKMRYLV
jgi:uncharacterized metal-binding protein